MKICFECKTNKSLDCFSKNTSKKDGLSSHCKECHKILRRNHYLKNKQKIYSQVKQTRSQYKQWFQKLKDKPCADCKNKYPYYCMDFDHLTNNKKFNVSQLYRANRKKELLKEEIEKCELVCANCHRIRTFKRLNKASLT
jgi:hypothetical protein